MKDYRREDFLDEHCSSEKEIGELQEISDLLFNMEEAQISPSFQAQLRKTLLEKAGEQKDLEYGKPAERGKVPFVLFTNKTEDNKTRPRLLPVFMAAATVVLVIAFTIFYSGGGVPSLPGMTSPAEPPPDNRISLVEGEEREPEGDEHQDREVDPSSPVGDGLPGDEKEEEKDEVETPDETEQEADVPQQEEKEEGADPDRPSPAEEQETEEETIQEDPDFEVWKNRKNFRLAGEIQMPPSYYPAREEDKLETTSVINYTWDPGKISVATNDSKAFGTSSWGERILANEGFAVNEDQIEVKTFETQKGNFAEIFFRPGVNPPLIVHYQEGTGILSFYYEEKGEVAEPGFYKLLTPAQALEKIEQLKLYAPDDKLSFSFQKVSLTYHEFFLEENEKGVKLPAYSFVGMGSHGEFKVHLPAVK